MTHKVIFEMFDKITGFGPEVEKWFTNGRNSIRVRLNNKTEYIFTYHSPRKWRFETYESFAYGVDRERMK